MGVTITRRGTPPRFDPKRIAAVIKGTAPGMILERTNKGIDANGQQFAPYSRRYQNLLRRMGEDPKIDLRLSGGLLNSVKARGATLHPDRVEVTIAPDTGTSPQYKAPSTRGELAKTQWDRGRGLFMDEGAYAGPLRRGASSKLGKALTPRKIKTGKQSPPHNIVGYWLHYGTPTMKARPWMGLTDAQYTELVRDIARVCFR